MKPSPAQLKRTGKACIAGVIPARYGSTRFPGKMLHPIHGKPLIRHVWENACRAKALDCLIVATDDMRIAKVAFDFGAEVAWTKADHPSGTDRVAEVAARLRGVTHVVNIQGDEPSLPPALINRLAAALAADPKIEMVTAARPLDPVHEDPSDPNLVKVVVARDARALYFSRCPIPFVRDAAPAHASHQHLVHIGLYGYKIDTLLALVRRKPTSLEQAEKLEQLRALEHGIGIRVLRTSHKSAGIDTPEDARRYESQTS